LLRWRLRRRPVRAFLGLTPDSPVEVIVSTNATRAAAAGEARTHMTAIGELRSVAVGARTVLPLYPEKKVSVFMSEEYPGRLQNDTLIMGGPLRNRYAERFLGYVNETYPEAGLLLDAPTARIGIEGQGIHFDQRRANGLPREDLALLVLAKVPGSDGEHRRYVFCAGLSTYGTEGAARFFFQRVLSPSRDGVRLRRVLSGACVAAVVRVWIDGRQVIRTELHEDHIWSTRAVRRRPQPASALDRSALTAPGPTTLG
jgi:hypothetical protein